VVAIMAFFGFCNVYALRVNLSVAIVAMTSNYSYIENGTEQFVSTFYHVTVSSHIHCN
jgi:ACS family sodium-dependent inorganic phosphate cotransporter